MSVGLGLTSPPKDQEKEEKVMTDKETEFPLVDSTPFVERVM